LEHILPLVVLVHGFVAAGIGHRLASDVHRQVRQGMAHRGTPTPTAPVGGAGVAFHQVVGPLAVVRQRHRDGKLQVTVDLAAHFDAVFVVPAFGDGTDLVGAGQVVFFLVAVEAVAIAVARAILIDTGTDDAFGADAVPGDPPIRISLARQGTVGGVGIAPHLTAHIGDLGQPVVLIPAIQHLPAGIVREGDQPLRGIVVPLQVLHRSSVGDRFPAVGDHHGTMMVPDGRDVPMRVAVNRYAYPITVFVMQHPAIGVVADPVTGLVLPAVAILQAGDGQTQLVFIYQ